MKRILASALCLLMLFTLALPLSASASTQDGKYGFVHDYVLARPD